MVKVNFSRSFLESLPGFDERWRHLTATDDPDTREMRSRFIRWTYRNPSLVSLYRDAARRALDRLIESGVTNPYISNWQPVYEIRTRISKDGYEEYKVNNGYIAYLGRWLVSKEPEFADVFDLHVMRGQVKV